MLQTVDRIAVSGSDASIFDHGRKWNGKGISCRAYAARWGKKLISTNMAAIPRDTAESELFGHVKRRVYGAYADKPGLIEQAHNGIFFLDELGECSLPIQAKLLRAVEEHEIKRVGGVLPKKISVQFVAATNRNLQLMVEQGEFRLDLLQRLNLFTLHLPPLRERPEDIQYYATLFLEEKSKKDPFSIKASGIDALMSYPWSGNVRELHNLSKDWSCFLIEEYWMLKRFKNFCLLRF